MAKQIVNIGSSANDRTGDSLRAAFQKINANFTELYTSLGLDEAPLNLGAFEFTGSTLTTSDSSDITIDQNVNITSNLTMSGDIVPAETGKYDLGSPDRQFRSIYVTNNTVFFGTIPLRIDESGTLYVNGQVAATPGGAVTWSGVTGKPTFSNVATSGDYNDLSNRPTIFDGDYNNLSNIPALSQAALSGSYTDLSDKPTIPADVGDLTDTGSLLFDGDYTRLSNVPTIPTDISDLTDNSNLLQGPGSGASVTISDTAPNTPSAGNLWWESDTGRLKIYYNDGTTSQWVDAFTLGYSANSLGDIKGSVFADDSTLLVDGVNGKIVAPININDNEIFDGAGDTGLNIRSNQTDGNIYLYSYGSDGDGTGAGNIYVKSDAVEIYSDWQNGGAGEKKWTFGGNGSLTFPDATVQTTAWTGSVGNISVNTDFTITVDTGDSSSQVWQFDTGGVLTFPNGQQVDAEDANELLIGTPNAGLILNSQTQSSRLVAKKTFDREFNYGVDQEIDAIVGPPHLITVTFGTDTGLYLLPLLARLEDKLSNELTDFRFDYSNIRMVINPYAEAIPANILMVSQASGTTWNIAIDQDPTAVVGNVTDIQILYDYNNTVGLDVGEDMFGIATDNDDIDIRSGRDIDLIAADDITFRAGSTFDLTLLRNDGQAPDDGIEIITESSTLTNIWNFRFDGHLHIPGNIAGTNGISITPENAETYTYFNLPSDANSSSQGVAIGNDNGKIELRTTDQGTSNSYVWKFDNDGSLTTPGGYIKPDATDGFLTVEGPLFADMVREEGGGVRTITNGVKIRTHRAFDDIDRDWNFSWDGAIYAPRDASNYQVGAIEWRTGDVTSQVRRTEGGTLLSGRVIPPGLMLFSNGTGAVSVLTGNGKYWTFEENGDLTIPGGIRSDGDINIDINLSDSTLRRWSFGEDGNLNLAGNLQFPVGAEIRESGNGELRLRGAAGQAAQLQGLDTNGSVDSAVKALYNDGVGSFVTINTNIDASEHIWSFDYNGDLTVPNYINFAGNTFIGDEPGAGTPYFRINTPLGYAATITTDSDISGNNWSWTFGEDGNLTLPGELHGAPVMSVGPTPSQVGRTVNITPADDASDKKFRFRVDQYAGQTFTRAYLELPTAEVDKQVAAVFPHANGKAGFIYTQGNDTNGQGMNDAFNIFYNNGDIKITSMGSSGGLYTWKFGDSGDLTIPGDIRSEGNINIDINLSDSTLRRWRFGEDGHLNLAGYLQFPNGAEIRNNTGDLRLRSAPGDAAQLQGLTTDGAVDAEVKAFHDIETGSYVTINTNVDAGAPEQIWTFDYNGDLTVPGDITRSGTNGEDLTITAGSETSSGDGGRLYLRGGSGFGAGGYGPVQINDLGGGVWLGKSDGTSGDVQTYSRLQIHRGVTENYEAKADATGVVEHDCDAGHLFYHTSPDANWTVNLTNLNSYSTMSTNIVIVIEQGGTPYYPNALQIGGAAQTIKWLGNATPTPQANKTEIATFTIFYNGSNYNVLGSYSTYG